MAQVAHKRHAFQKHFRQHDRGPDVEINATAIHASHQLRETTEVRVRCCSQCGAIAAGMKVCDVATDRDMRSERNLRFVRGAKQRVLAMLRILREQRTADSLTEPDLISRAVTRRTIE